jgi:hypothetical protein
MRSSAFALVLVVSLSGTASAAPSSVAKQPRVVRWAKGLAKSTKETWKNPVARKKLIGNVAFNAVVIGLGEAADFAARHLGMPGGIGAVVSGTVVTAGGYYLQRRVARLMPTYVEPPQLKTPGQLAIDATIGGAVGGLTGWGLDKVGNAAGNWLPAAARFTIGATRKSGRWLARKVFDKKIGDGTQYTIDRSRQWLGRKADRVTDSEMFAIRTEE